MAGHLKRSLDQVFYWRKGEEDEIDFIVCDAQQLITNIEVKYQAQINPSNLFDCFNSKSIFNLYHWLSICMISAPATRWIKYPSAGS